jgi:heat shock protein HslJ
MDGGSGHPGSVDGDHLLRQQRGDVGVGGVTMTAEFEDGTVSGNTGCNTFNGP